MNNLYSIIWRESGREGRSPPPIDELADYLSDYIVQAHASGVPSLRAVVNGLEAMSVDETDHAVARAFSSTLFSAIIARESYLTATLPHFILLSKIDIGGFLAEVEQVVREDWEGNDRHLIKAQRETRSINLFVRGAKDVSSRHDQFVQMACNAMEFPELVAWLKAFALQRGHGNLQRARIVKLRPNGRVFAHVDRGLYYLVRDRCHLVLKAKRGSLMRCENQESVWQSGEVWWFNNHVTHEAYNDSDDDRIHVIFDILPQRNYSLSQYLQQFVRAKVRQLNGPLRVEAVRSEEADVIVNTSSNVFKDFGSSAQSQNEDSACGERVEGIMAERSLCRLIRVQREDGSFLYKYNPSMISERRDEYNNVRHAGCAYALAWAASEPKFQNIQGLQRAAQSAVEFLLPFLRYYDGNPYVSEARKSVGNLGATALLSCALSFRGCNNEYRDLYLHLRESITTAQRDDGSFCCRFGVNGNSGKGARYYPGEALLAVARYCEMGLASSSFPMVIDRAFGYYKRLFEDAPHRGMVLWHGDAWTRLHRVSVQGGGTAKPGSYLDFAVAIGDWILQRQLPSGGFSFGREAGISTALYVEALSRVAQGLTTASRIVGNYETGIKAGLNFIVRLHFSADEMSNGVRSCIFGGTPSSFSRSLFRMDNDQHLITMCLARLETPPPRERGRSAE